MNPNPENHQPSLIELIKSLKIIDLILIGMLVFISLILIITIIRPVGVFHNNQHLYYLFGMYEAGVDYLQNDPVASDSPYHMVFSKIVYLLQLTGELALSSQLFAAFLILIFGAGCVLFSLSLLSSWRQREGQTLHARDMIVAFLIGSIYINMINSTLLTNIAGMTGMNLVSPYFQASGFSVFIIPGIAFMVLKRWGWATLCLSISSVLHPHYFILSTPLMLFLVLEAYRNGRLMYGISLFAIFSLINLPLFIIEPLQWSQINGTESRYIMNELRAPHHYSVQYWWSLLEIVQLTIMGTGLLLALWKYSSTLWNIFLAYFGVIVLSIAFVAYTNNQIVASLVPWRASSFLLPLTQILIFGTVIIIIFELLPDRFLTPALLITVILTSIHLIALNPFNTYPAYYDYTTPEIEMVRANTTSVDIVLIPPYLDENFRLYAERPIFATWKAHEYDLVVWYNKVLIADEMQTANLERRVEICGDYDFAYYMVAIETFNGDETTAIDRTEGYLLFACP